MRYGIWAPIPQWVGGTVKWGDRYGTRPRAIVIHRMEGTLEGSDSYLRREFADYSPFPRLNASTHWGVGLWNGVPQIRQWVDGNYSAFGWSATPTDVPTPLARQVFGDRLTGMSTWPYWRSTSDLNRDVLAIEVEGFHYQPWESRTRAKVIELINAIVDRYGPMWIVTHTDMSTKPCAGLTTMRAALPMYGTRYAGPALPDTSSTIRVSNLPMSGFKRHKPTASAVIRVGKPRRDGATLSAKNLGTTTEAKRFRIWGEVKGQDFGAGPRWFFGPQWIGSQKVIYIPLVDLRDLDL